MILRKMFLRCTIYEMHDNREYPTLKSFVRIMRDKIKYRISITSMRFILKNLSFRYKRTNDGSIYLLERGDVVVARLKFPRASGDSRPIIYLDETWVNQNHARKDIWQDSSGRGDLKDPVCKGSRLIIYHAGSASPGFIPGSKWVFRSRPKNRNVDYHSEMNAESF